MSKKTYCNCKGEGAITWYPGKKCPVCRKLYAIEKRFGKEGKG